MKIFDLWVPKTAILPQRADSAKSQLTSPHRVVKRYRVLKLLVGRVGLEPTTGGL